MIYAVFGMPGSGKSYYVVNEFILKRISHGVIISNIVLSDDISIPENYRYLIKYDMDNLHKNIKKIMEDSEKSHDEKKVLLRYLFQLYGDGDITLIIDECHLYGYRGRSSSISYIDDFLSIHRHIFVDRKFDIVLITQVPSRLNTEIAAQVEVAVKAIPASQRLVTSMLEYSVFGSVESLKKNDTSMRMKRLILRGDPKVFSFYQSGFVNKGSGDFRRKLFFIVIGLFFTIGFMFYQFSGLVSGDTLPHSVNPKVLDNNISIMKDNNDTNLTSSSFEYKIICRPYIKGLDIHKVKGFMYALLRDGEPYQFCYRRYLNV